MKYILVFALLLAGRMACFGQGFARVYTNPQMDSGTTNAFHLKNRGNLLVRYGFRYPSISGMIITRADSLGSPTWSYKYKPTGANPSGLGFMDGQELADGSFILKGWYPYTGLVRIKPNGQVIWSKKESFKYYNQDTYRSPIAFTPSKRKFWISIIKQGKPTSFSIVKMDTSGRVEGSIEYTKPGVESVQLLGVMPTKSNLYLYCYFRYRNTNPQVSYHGSCVVVEADTNGVPLRVRRLPDSDSVSFSSYFGMGRFPDKGTFICGPFNSHGGSAQDSYYTYFFHNHLSYVSRLDFPSYYMVATDEGIHSFNQTLNPGGSNARDVQFIDSSLTVTHATVLLNNNAGSYYPYNTYFGQYGIGNTDADYTIGAHDWSNGFQDSGYFKPRIGQNAFSFAHLYYNENSCINTPASFSATYIHIPLVDDSIRYHVDTLTLKDQPLLVEAVPLCVLDFCNMPKLNLGPDLAVCGNTYTLTAPTLFPGQHQRWSTGDTAAAVSLPVPGIYTLLINGLCGSYRDTISLSRSSTNAPAPAIRPRPLATCPQGEIVLGVQRSGDGGVPLSWTINGTLAQASAADSLYIRPINPTNRDSILVVAVMEGEGACIGRDSLRITLWPGYPNFLGPDIVTCQPDTVLARPTFATDISWLWHLPGGATSPASFLRVREAGLYSGSFTAKGCLYADTVLVKGDLASRLPNLITLNGDGLNRYFRADCLLPGALVLYNRWGQKVFSHDSYDGLWPPLGTEPGVYFYHYSGLGGKALSGWVEVVR